MILPLMFACNSPHNSTGNTVTNPDVGTGLDDLSFQNTFCSTNETLLGTWEDSSYTGDHFQRPFITFQPMGFFSALFPNVGPIEGYFDLVSRNKMSVKYSSVRRTNVESDSNYNYPSLFDIKTDYVFNISGNEISITIANGQTYRLQKDPTTGDILTTANLFRRDGLCSRSELPPMEWTANYACPQEMLNGEWDYVFPSFSERKSPESIVFVPITLEQVEMVWNYLDYSDPGGGFIPYQPRNQSLLDFKSIVYGSSTISGHFSVTGSTLNFNPTYNSRTGTVSGTSTSFLLNFYPPLYMSMTSTDGQEILLGRNIYKMKELSGSDYRRYYDGICASALLTSCPITTMLGLWETPAFYKVINTEDRFNFSPSLNVASFDQVTFSPDGVVHLTKSGISVENLYYQVMECSTCDPKFRLRLSRSLPIDSSGTGNDFPLEVAANSIVIDLSPTFEIGPRMQFLVLNKISSVDTTSMTCLLYH